MPYLFKKRSLSFIYFHFQIKCSIVFEMVSSNRYNFYHIYLITNHDLRLRHTSALYKKYYLHK